MRARLPFTFSRSIRMLWLIKLKVGTSFRMRSYVVLSSVTVCWALSLTFPFDHFFFFAAFPPLDVGAALALAYRIEENICQSMVTSESTTFNPCPRRRHRNATSSRSRPNAWTGLAEKDFDIPLMQPSDVVRVCVKNWAVWDNVLT